MALPNFIVILKRYDTEGDGDGLVLMDWYEIEVGQRVAGNNHEYYIKIRFIFIFNSPNSYVPFRLFLSWWYFMHAIFCEINISKISSHRDLFVDRKSTH